eukprot:g7312.t1
MREQDNFVKQTLKRVDTCEKQQLAVSNSMNEFEKDCQDLRDTELQMRRDLTSVENVFEKLSKSVDITSEKLADMKEEAEETKKEMIKKIEMMIEKNKAAGGKLQGRVRALEDAGKNSQRKNDLRLQDLERTIFDRLYLVGQHQQQNVKDFQKSIEQLRKDINGKLQKKGKDIDNNNKEAIKQKKLVHSVQRNVKEMQVEVNRLNKIEVKVEKLLDAMQNGPNGIAMAALQKAEHVEKQLVDTLKNGSFVQNVENDSVFTTLDNGVNHTEYKDPIIEQLKELNAEEKNTEENFKELDSSLKATKLERREIVKQMRDAKKINDKVTAAQLSDKLDQLDDTIEIITAQHEGSKQELEQVKQNVEALKNVAIAGGKTEKQLISMINTENSDSEPFDNDEVLPEHNGHSRQSSTGSLLVSLPSVPKSRDRLSTRTPKSRDGNSSRGSKAHEISNFEIAAIQSEMESERRLRLELENELRDTRKIQDALLHTQEQLREKIQGLKIYLENETQTSIAQVMERVENLMETNQIKQLEDMENQRLRLEKANVLMRKDQEVLIKKLKDSNLTLRKHLLDSGIEFNMESIVDGNEEDDLKLANNNNENTVTNTQYHAHAQVMLEEIQEQHRQEMSKMREEFLLVNKHANKDKVHELNDVITNMKKMHQDTLAEHKKDMERMKAKIAQHSLKVDSFKAVAEADLAETNYAKKLIDEQARILSELDIDQLAAGMNEKVEKKLFESMETRFENEIRQLERVSQLAQTKHLETVSKEAQKYIHSLKAASKEVQQLHEKHLSGHREKILEMANSMEKQHEKHMVEVQGVVSEVHKSLSDINENSKYHMKKFGIQSQQVQMKISDFEKIYRHEEAKKEYRHLREMRKLQKMMLEDRENMEKELMVSKQNAEKEHEQFIKFTAKLTHENDKMKRKYEQQLADLQQRIQDGYVSKEYARSKMSAYAEQTTVNRIQNNSMMPIHPEHIQQQTSQEFKKTEITEDSGAIGFRDAHLGVFTPELPQSDAEKPVSNLPDFPKSYPLHASKYSESEKWDMSRNEVRELPIATNSAQTNGIYATSLEGRNVDMFIHKTEFALNSTKQLIVAVHERLSGEIVALQDAVKQFSKEGDVSRRIKEFWSQAGDLKKWKNKVVDVTEENKALLAELRRTRHDHLILKSPIRTSPNKYKVKQNYGSNSKMKSANSGNVLLPDV